MNVFFIDDDILFFDYESIKEQNIITELITRRVAKKSIQ